MKKFLTILLALTMLLSLAACGGDPAENRPDAAPDGTEEPGEAVGETVDLQALYDDFMVWMAEEYGEENVPQTDELDAEVLDMFYPGLSGMNCKQLVTRSSAISAVAFEMVLAEMENEEDAKAAAEIFQNNMDYQVEEGAWYPATVEAWENGQVIRNGSYVALLVAGEAQAQAVEAFQALFA